MKLYFNGKEFAKAIKTKRIIELNTGLRELGEKLGMSASTLSRYENELLPDIINYAKICKWLGVKFDHFITTKKQ